MKTQTASKTFPLPPQIGAQVFVEPGQTPKDIGDWFRILEENGMTVCRIRMFETHMHKADGTWDFSLYDEAFRAAERHHVKVFATLFPADDTVGGFKYPKSEAHLAEISEYVKTLVTHFKSFPALFTWVLQNEPGTGGEYTDSDLACRLRKEREASRPKPQYTSGGFRQAHFDYEEFQRYYTCWFLNWYAQQVRKYDPGHELHVNPHAIFSTFPEYDFPAWRTFITSLGASAHPVWHYIRMFRQEQFALAISANMDIIRAGAGPLPFWLTELQGGFNLYSGFKALCPTKEETAQWLWLTLGSGVKGIIFWSLNPRATIDEPGEWGLITYQREASDRLIAAREVIRALHRESDLFATAKPLCSGVTLLLSRESSWTDRKQCLHMGGDYEARRGNAPIKSTVAWYEALTENGIGAEIAEMDNFDWDQESYQGQVLILSHQISIPSRHWPHLIHAVERGAKLIVEGTTGYFDEHQVCVMQTGFPLAELLGGTISEFKVLGEKFDIAFHDGRILPAHLWRGTIKNASGEVLAAVNDEIFATRHTFGKGETLWIPSPAGMAAWQGDNSALAKLVRDEILSAVQPPVISFEKQEKLVLLRVLVSGNSLVTIIINNDNVTKKIPLVVKKKLKPTLIFASKEGEFSDTQATLAAGETLVLSWQ